MAVDLLAQALALQQLHGDEPLPIAFLDGVDGADIGMVQRRRGARFLLKAFQCRRILLRLAAPELQRDMTAEIGVFGLVHDTHTAGAQLS